MAEDYYFGSYLNAIDVKSRVSVPPAFRAIVAARSTDRTMLVGKSPFYDCLVAYDPSYAHRLRSEIEARFGQVNSRERVAAIRSAFGALKQLSIDDAHRITLTDGMRDTAGLDRLALFVGADEYFELWDPHAYLALEDADPEIAADTRRGLAAKGEAA